MRLHALAHPCLSACAHLLRLRSSARYGAPQAASLPWRGWTLYASARVRALSLLALAIRGGLRFTLSASLRIVQFIRTFVCARASFSRSRDPLRWLVYFHSRLVDPVVCLSAFTRARASMPIGVLAPCCACTPLRALVRLRPHFRLGAGGRCTHLPAPVRPHCSLSP